MNFSKTASALPGFATLSAARRFLGGYCVRRVIVQHHGKFYICAPSTARQCHKRVVFSC